jgi:hypothetical protein
MLPERVLVNSEYSEMEHNNILVIGPAKTGTTVISKAIQHSLKSAQYHLEPKSIIFFEQGNHVDASNPQVVKIIFEHWNAMPRMRNALIHNEAKMKFRKVVAIKRDPRDELISRLLYIIYPYTQANGYDNKFVSKWIELWADKERNPKSLSIYKMIEVFNKLSGMNFLGFLNRKVDYSRFLTSNKKRLFTISYEDFMRGKLRELEDYCGFFLVLDRGVDELTRTARSCSYNNWKKYFTDQDVDIFKKILGELTEGMGYTDWQLEDVDALDPKHCSEYLCRLVRESCALSKFCKRVN